MRIRDDVCPMGEDLGVTTVPLDRSLAPGRIELFASAPNDPRARRPIDWIRAAVSTVAVVVVAVLAEIGGNLDSDVGLVATEFPPVLEALWLTAFWLAS